MYHEVMQLATGTNADEQAAGLLAINRQTVEPMLTLRNFVRVVESAYQGVAVVNQGGRCIYANQAFANITDYLPETLLGLDWARIFHLSELRGVARAVEQMRRRGKSAFTLNHHADGTEIPGKRVTLIKLSDRGDRYDGHVCLFNSV